MCLGFIDSVFFKNDQLVEINTIVNSEKTSNKAIYEVFRVIGGKPLFIYGHLERLKNSLNKSEIRFSSSEPEQLKKRIKKLCEVNHKDFGNIELRISVDEQGNINKYLGFIKHSYPDATAYIHGIATKTLNVVRKNPAVKAKNTNARKLSNDFISENNLYEVLLVNNRGELTEGSRSNLFLIKGNMVYTAPNTMVLEGITRMKVLQALNNLEIELVSDPINLSEISEFQSAFICGTSPGVLPINRINRVEFDVLNKILREIILEYNNIVNDYLSGN